MNRMQGKGKHGFTLIELLAVIIVISLLAAILIPRIGGKMGKAKTSIAKTTMKSVIGGAIENFNLDCDRYPATLDELMVLPEALEGKWDGPYLKPAELLDPWGNPYQYTPEGQLNPGSFDLMSFGADGQPGGEGDNADIFND